MKKIFVAAAVVCTLFSLASCGVSTRTADSKVLHAGMSISSVNVGDLKVSDKRESYTYQASKKDMRSAKSNATYEFLEKFGADVLVEPRYEVTMSGTTQTIKVSGRPAWLTNVRQAPAPTIHCCHQK